MSVTTHQLDALRRVLDQVQAQNSQLIGHRRLLSLLQEKVPGFLLAHRQVESMLYEADEFMSAVYQALTPEMQPRPMAVREVQHSAQSRSDYKGEEPLPLRRHASTVRTVVQDRHFAVMLDAIESTASDMGFVFERGVRGEELSLDQIRILGEAALRAQMQFVAPGELDRVRDTNVANLRENGDAVQCAGQILSALEENLIVIQRRFPNSRQVIS